MAGPGVFMYGYATPLDNRGSYLLTALPNQPSYGHMVQPALPGAVENPPPPYPKFSSQSTTIIQSPAPRRPPYRTSTWIGLAVFVLLCCNPVFGLMAFIFSIMSGHASDKENYVVGKLYGQCSMWLSISGIVVSVSALAGFIVYWFILTKHSIY